MDSDPCCRPLASCFGTQARPDAGLALPELPRASTLPTALRMGGGLCRAAGCVLPEEDGEVRTGKPNVRSDMSSAQFGAYRHGFAGWLEN